MQRCLRANWQLMIVLQDKDLSTLWQELRALHTLKVTSFAALLGKAPTALHLGQRHRLGLWFERESAAPSCTGVGCEKSWETIDEQARTVTETSRHAWLSRQPLSHNHVHERCNLGARHRGGIEAGSLVEKHQGYHYEHALALNWHAMHSDHLRMRLAHAFNTLARFTQQ